LTGTSSETNRYEQLITSLSVDVPGPGIVLVHATSDVVAPFTLFSDGFVDRADVGLELQIGIRTVTLFPQDSQSNIFPDEQISGSAYITEQGPISVSLTAIMRPFSSGQQTNGSASTPTILVLWYPL
jgi:hypothetical protein